MNKLYLVYEFNVDVCGIACRCTGTKGYSIINDDGSRNPEAYMEALNRIMYVLARSNDTVLITFGDGSFVAEGLDQSYGRLIRHWGGGKLGYVVWDDHGNLVTRFENEDAVPERKLARSFIDIMVERHKRVHGMEAEA